MCLLTSNRTKSMYRNGCRRKDLVFGRSVSVEYTDKDVFVQDDSSTGRPNRSHTVCIGQTPTTGIHRQGRRTAIVQSAIGTEESEWSRLAVELIANTPFPVHHPVRCRTGGDPAGAQGSRRERGTAGESAQAAAARGQAKPAAGAHVTTSAGKSSEPERGQARKSTFAKSVGEQ
jgi:hypothetical protein